MLEWIRQWLRAWMGMDDDRLSLADSILDLQSQVDQLRDALRLEQDWRREFTASLRNKSSVKATPRYTDYESSQQAVLSEFEGE